MTIFGRRPGRDAALATLWERIAGEEMAAHEATRAALLAATLAAARWRSEAATWEAVARRWERSYDDAVSRDRMPAEPWALERPN